MFRYSSPRRQNGSMPAGAPLARALHRESCSSSLVHEARSVLLAVVALFSLISAGGLLAPAGAQAATWPLPVPAFSVELGFHETYTAGDKSYAHSGIDIPASAGLQIFSPLAGTVRYTGAVPSGDSRLGAAGGADATMQAVSVQIADGRSVTLMPFASVSVKEGQRVSEGEVLGTLASQGDISSPGVHLHMGLKKGSTYYDPLTLFGSAGSAGARKDAAEEMGASAGDAHARENASAAEELSAQAPSEAFSWQDAADSLPAEDAAAEQFGTIQSAEVEWEPAQGQQEGALSRLGSLFRPLLQACARQAEGLWNALGGFAYELGIPTVLLLALCLGGCSALVALAALAVARYLLPRMRNMWQGAQSPLVERNRG